MRRIVYLSHFYGFECGHHQICTQQLLPSHEARQKGQKYNGTELINGVRDTQTCNRFKTAEKKNPRKEQNSANKNIQSKIHLLINLIEYCL